MKKVVFLIFILFVVFLLRFYKLSEYPVGFHSDETAYGYNAYSLLLTGSDEFGERWPLSLKSFGDYKPPMSSWISIPSIWLFGLNEFAIRFPTALLGSLTILTIYFLTTEFVKQIYVKPYSKGIIFVPFIAALLLTISPWHNLFSRTSQLVGLEVFFTSTGVLFLLKGLKNKLYLYLSTLLFSGAIYTYYGARVTIFLLLILFTFLQRTAQN